LADFGTIGRAGSAAGSLRPNIGVCPPCCPESMVNAASSPALALTD
jgi:hypothetical protein